MCAFVLMRNLLLPVGERIYFTFTAALFACCVHLRIKHVIMAEFRYEKHGGHQGLLIILTARVVFWHARAGRKYSRLLEWARNVCAMILGFIFSSLPSPTVMCEGTGCGCPCRVRLCSEAGMAWPRANLWDPL